jgi:hypothetical protein
MSGNAAFIHQATNAFTECICFVIRKNHRYVNMDHNTPLFQLNIILKLITRTGISLLISTASFCKLLVSRSYTAVSIEWTEVIFLILTCVSAKPFTADQSNSWVMNSGALSLTQTSKSNRSFYPCIPSYTKYQANKYT